MALREVQAQTKQYTLDTAAGALTIALTTELKTVPPQKLAEFTLALAWVESGRGAVTGNNPGNVACAGFSNGVEKFWISSGDYWRPPWFATTGSTVNKLMLSGLAPSAFRSYPSEDVGWRAFAHEVVRRKAVVDAALEDDALAFSLALRDSKYSPDYGPQHESTFRKLVDDIERRKLFTAFAGVAMVPSAVPASQSKSSAGVIVLLVVSAAIAAGWYWSRHSKMKRKVSHDPKSSKRRFPYGN
jgi:hypothetical protein